MSADAVALYVADAKPLLRATRARLAPQAVAAAQWEILTLGAEVERLTRLVDRLAMRTKTPYVQAALKPRGF